MPSQPNKKRSAADDIGRQCAKSARPQPRRPQILDPNGDLLIIVEVNETGQVQAGSTPTVEKEFLVSSNILRLVSPIFRCMLASNFAEGVHLKNCSESKEIAKLHLPDDNSLGMQLLLRIAHHHPLSVAEEESLTMHNVGAFVLACHKYDCLHTFTFRAAAERWLLAPHQLKKDDWSRNALIVAFTIGDDDLFEVVTKELILRSVRSFQQTNDIRHSKTVHITMKFGPVALPDRIIGESASSTAFHACHWLILSSGT